MCDKLYLKQGYCNPRLDKCLIDIVREINADPKLKTLASCCGHDKYSMTIVVRNKDGDIYDLISNTTLGVRKRNRYYKKDAEGYYYIPEVILVK